MNRLAEEWKSVYGAYMAAQKEYLELKLSSDLPRNKLLSESFHGRFAACKLDRALGAMETFLAAHPTLMDSPTATPELELTRRRHPTEDLIIERKDIVRESVLEDLLEPA